MSCDADEFGIADRQAKASEDQSDTAKQTRLDERYQRGVEMLNNDSEVVCLSGIHVLSSLSKSNPEEFHCKVLDVFCALLIHLTKNLNTNKIFFQPAKNTNRITDFIKNRTEIQCKIEKDNNYILNIEESKLPASNLQNANFNNALIRKVNFQKSNLQNANFNNAQGSIVTEEEVLGLLYENDIEEKFREEGKKICEDIGVNFQDANLIGANFCKSNLYGATFEGADLESAIFEEATLTHVNFSEARCNKANFEKAELYNATMTSPVVHRLDKEPIPRKYGTSRPFFKEAIFIKANLKEANLEGAVLTKARMQRAQLEGANLIGAFLEGADLTGAKLDGANFTNASLEGANLTEAELGWGATPNHSTNFTKVNLKGANLSGVKNLGEAKFTEAKYDKNTKIPDGLNPEERGMILITDHIG